MRYTRVDKRSLSCKDEHIYRNSGNKKYPCNWGTSQSCQETHKIPNTEEIPYRWYEEGGCANYTCYASPGQAELPTWIDHIHRTILRTSVRIGLRHLQQAPPYRHALHPPPRRP